MLQIAEKNQASTHQTIKTLAIDISIYFTRRRIRGFPEVISMTIVEIQQVLDEGETAK